MASALAFAALMLTPPAGPVALDTLIAFSDPVRCEPAEPFREMLDRLWVEQRTPRQPPHVVPPAYRAAFGDIVRLIGNNGRVSIGMETTGTWHGISIVGLELSKMPEQKTPTLAIHYGAPMSQVRNTLLAQGFRFGRLTSGPAIALEPSLGAGATTLLTCEPHD